MVEWPEQIESEDQLDELLSRPGAGVVPLMERLDGDILILGAGGKMGVSLAQMARRACAEAGSGRQVMAASRFTNPVARRKLEEQGIRTLVCDLLDPDQVASLPLAPNVIYMAGKKFGTSGNEAETWASNVIASTAVAQRFVDSRIVAFSTGCVYPLVSAVAGGCTEETPPDPVGEYAQSCLGRERVFQHFSAAHGTQTCLIRLNYAVEMRYGVLHDIAQRVWNGEPVDAAVANANVIWQADANAYVLRALEHCHSPATILNITGPETFAVAAVARQFGAIFGKPVAIRAGQSDVGYLNDASRAFALFGYPQVSLQRLIRWTAGWIARGGGSFQLATHYEVNTGRF